MKGFIQDQLDFSGVFGTRKMSAAIVGRYCASILILMLAAIPTAQAQQCYNWGTTNSLGSFFGNTPEQAADGALAAQWNGPGSSVSGSSCTITGDLSLLQGVGYCVASVTCGPPGCNGTQVFQAWVNVFQHAIACPPTPLYFVSTATPAKSDLGCSVDCSKNPVNGVGDPINPANGNVYKSEVDWIPASGASALAFRRFYNSQDDAIKDLGVAWRHSFSRNVVAKYDLVSPIATFGSGATNSSQYPDPSTACTSGFLDIRATVSSWQTATASYSGGVCALTSGGVSIGTIPVLQAAGAPPAPSATAVEFDVTRDDGLIVRFPVLGGVIAALPGVELRLQQTGGGFTLTDGADNTETYDTNGRLLSIRSRGGVLQTLIYDGSSRLSTVTDSFGYSLTLAYDTQSRLTSITDPSSHTVQYGYDSQGRLSTVTNADTTSRTYVYESGSFPAALTGVIDENASRYSTWGYDPQNRGTSTQEAGGANAVTLVYNLDGSVKSTDALGSVRTFIYRRVGDRNLVSGISGSQCPTCSMGKAATYDTGGYINSRTDYNNNVTQYVNGDPRGLETSRTEAYGTPRARTIATSWNSTFRLPSLITEPNRTTGFTYDASGNALTKTITDTATSTTRVWTYTYYSFGQVLTADGPRTDVVDKTTYTYYACSTGYQCGQINTISNALGQVTTFNTYNANGQPLTITDPNGVVTTLTYDARQRLTSRQVGTETTGFGYWPTGQLKKVTLPDTSYIQYTYDAAHRLTDITDSLGNKIHYTLDAMGNRTAENAYDPGNTLHRTHTRVFNTLSQLYQDVNAAGTAAVTTTFGYDLQGNQTTIAAPLTRNTTNAYDELNRLSQITDPGTGITQFQYDGNDNLTQVTDPRTLITTYQYNGFGDLKQQTSPDTGTTLNTYDSGGNLKTSTDARSKVGTYSYDALNRVTQVLYTDQTINFGYDAGTNGKGHLTSASDASHSMSWTYDGVGRVTGKGQTVGTVTKSIGYGFTNGNLATMTLPSGQIVTYQYNTNHQITGITLGTGTPTTILSSVAYEPLGPVKGWTWGNATTTTRSFDTDGKVSQIATTGINVTNTYQFDDAFRITGITDIGTAANSWTYGYDSLDRITSGAKTGTTRGWTYDANGNRKTETGSAASTFTISATNNRISSSTGSVARTYAYDTAGNALTYSTITATYNNRGRMATLKKGTVTETLVYNALGQMVKTSGGAMGTELFVYDESGHLVGEYGSTGTLIQETIWLGDTPVATIRPNGSTSCASTICIFYVHADHLNTPRRVSRGSDNKLLWTWLSDPFGTDAANQNPAAVGTFVYNLRFPGQIADSQAGLNQNGFRDCYDPATGRYCQSDPIGLLAGVNTYAYVVENPISKVDLLGLNPYQPSPLTALEEAIIEGNVEAVETLADAAGLSGSETSSLIARAAANANKMNHLFRKTVHNLDRLVKACGSEGRAYRNILDAGTKNFPGIKNGVVQDFSVTINGVAVTIRGILVNGQFELSTAFIP